MKLTRSLLAAFILLLLLSPLAASAADWPHLRGPGLDGRTGLPATLEGSALALEPGWRIPLGSGYSAVVVSEHRAVTMFADGEVDVIAAFDVATGRELWRHDLGPITAR